MIPKHFSLKSETPHAYEIHDARDGKTFHVAKHAINLDMHSKLAKIPRFAEGGSVEPEPNSSSLPQETPFDPNALPYGDTPTEPLGKRAGKFIKNTLAQAGEDTADAFGIAMKPGVDFAKGLFGADQSPPGTADAAGAAATTSEGATPPAPGAGVPGPTDGTIQPSGGVSPDPLQSRALGMDDVLSREESAIAGGAGAEAMAGRRQAEAFKAFQQEQQAATNDFQARHAKFEAADDSLQKAILEKSIDPEHWWNSRSTGQKISAGIGMLLSGMGSGVTGQPNHALKVINDAIERDIDAQKNDQSKNVNLWKMNHEAMKDDLQTHLAMRNQALTAVESQIKQYQAEAAGPLAAARAAPLLAQIRQQKVQNNFQRAALSQGSQGGMIGADPASFLSMVPESSRAEATKEITSAKELAQAKKTAFETFNRLKEINTIGNRITSPLQSSKEVAALRDNAAVALARDEAGRVNEFEFQAARQAFPAPGDNDATLRIKEQNLNNIANKKKVPGTAFKGATGLDLDRFISTSITPPSSPNMDHLQLDWARKNAGSPDPATQRRVSFIRQKFGMGG